MKKFAILIFFILLLSSCTVLKRAVLYGTQDINDYKIFPTYKFKQNKDVFSFINTLEKEFDKLSFKNNKGELQPLEAILANTSTRGFIVIRNDSILFEKYFRGYNRASISNVFSASKSVASLLVGIAIDEGYIQDINDPVTKYIKELRKADPTFQKLTIKHLLDMRSGLEFKEDYSYNPFSKIAMLYYGTNQLGKIKKLKFELEPGTLHKYQSVNTAVLGIVVEKATGKNLGQYFEEKVWKPICMENTGSWSLDDKKHSSAKAYTGLNISAIDLAKIGRLYINEGKFGAKQIVSKKWIKESLTTNVLNDGYQNQWYSYSKIGTDANGNRYFMDSVKALSVWEDRYKDQYPIVQIAKVSPKNYNKSYREKYMWEDINEYRWSINNYTGQFFARGLYGQLLYIDPVKKTIIVRLGDRNDFNYENLMYEISKKI